MNEIEKAMQDLELWYHPTTLEPERTCAIEGLSAIFEALKRKTREIFGMLICPSEGAMPS